MSVKLAYVDTSALTALALGEAGAASLGDLNDYDALFSSNLLEAELRSVFAREGVPFERSVFADVQWILPERPLTLELSVVLASGYLRGADLWHVATALYASPRPEDLAFVTLDRRQATVASGVGFMVVPAVAHGG